MSITCRPISAEQHLAFVQQRGSASFLQTPAWATVKPEWRGESVGFFADGELTGVALVLYRQLPKLKRYLAYVLSRLTAPGSLYLAVIALIPTIAFMAVGAQQNFPFGGTSILIFVGVGLDTVKKIESQLQQRNYEGFLK